MLGVGAPRDGGREQGANAGVITYSRGVIKIWTARAAADVMRMLRNAAGPFAMFALIFRAAPV